MLQSILHIGRASPIPQFILDTNHPWLEENKAWLSNYPDVEKAICSKESFLWRDGAHGHTLPEDLFSKLNIDNNKAGISRKGWKNAAERLQELKACPAALEDAKELHVDIYVHDSQHSDILMGESTMPPSSVPRLFTDVLAHMLQLTKLKFGVSGRATPAFHEAFAAANVTLPSLRYLVPGAYSEWLIRMCPNLETVQAGDYFDHWSWNTYDAKLKQKYEALPALVEATKGLPIKELKLRNGLDGWTLDLLENILAATPDLTSLEMNGDLETNHQPLLDDGARWDIHPSTQTIHSKLQPFFSILARFPQLENLRLPGSHELGLGFDGGAWCGNAYDGPGGRAYGRTVVQRSAELAEAVGRVVYEALPGLKTFSIGSQSPNIDVGEDGLVEMVWPWTGSMEAYTLDIWPM